MTEVTRPVFVVGAPRSGTTLLRVMLCRHPDVWILTETHLFDLWVPRYPALTTGSRTAFLAYWEAFTATEPFSWLGVDADRVAARVHAGGRWRAGDVMAGLLMEAAQVHRVSRVGEKTPDHAHHLRALFDAFPDARVAWMVRDPRATVASELALDATWASDDARVAARRWVDVTGGLAGWRHDPRVLAVRLEDLVGSPRATLARVCEHADLAWDDDVLADEGGNPDYRHGRHDPWAHLERRADTGDAPLTAWQRMQVEALTADVARQVGYPSSRLAGTVLRGLRSTRRAARTLSRAAGGRG